MAQKDTSGNGYWKAPTSPAGYKWAKDQYSPQLQKSIKGMYGGWQDLVDQPGIDMSKLPQTAEEWRNYKPKSLADMYSGFMEQNPEYEQSQFNQAMERVRGAGGGATQNLMNIAAARRGGGSYGGLDNSMDEINRAVMEGTMDISTAQAMKNIADQERRQQELIGYTGQDIGNQMGWLQGLTGAEGTDWANYLQGQGQGFNQQLGALQGQSGWMGQMIPYEQWNIQAPYEMGMQGAMNEEQVNAARRGESAGWFDRLMNWQNQQAGQYYTGQGQYGGYQGQRGNAILPGYDPSWLGWTQT